MKIFFALILLLVTLIGLVDGTVFKGRIEKIKKLATEFKENYYTTDSEEYKKELLLLSLPMMLGGAFLFIIELSFYIMVVNIGALTLPTIMMMCLMISGIFISIRKTSQSKKIEKTGLEGMDRIKRELASAEALMKTKTRTVRGMVIKVITLIYVLYALLILI